MLREQEDDALKVVLNVRDYRYISLLEQIKENAGINYQNLIKLGVLLLFQEEQHKISQYKKELEPEIQKQEKKMEVPKEKVKSPTAPGLEEQYTDMLKVHITFVGKMKDTIEAWQSKKGLSPHDIARLGLDKVYRFFTKDYETQKPFIKENNILSTYERDSQFSKYLEGKNKSILNFLKA